MTKMFIPFDHLSIHYSTLEFLMTYRIAISTLGLTWPQCPSSKGTHYNRIWQSLNQSPINGRFATTNNTNNNDTNSLLSHNHENFIYLSPNRQLQPETCHQLTTPTT